MTIGEGIVISMCVLACAVVWVVIIVAAASAAGVDLASIIRAWRGKDG